MLLVLQLIDRDAGFQNRTAAEQLARGLGAEFGIMSRQVHFSLPGIVQTWQQMRRESSFHLIHAFGPAALTAASVLGGRIVYTPAETPTLRAARWLRAIADHRNVQVICPTDTMRRFFVERGLPIERCHL